MRKSLLAVAAVAFLAAPLYSAVAQPVLPVAPLSQVKTRLDHFIDTPYVLVISYLPYEITRITCLSWTMLAASHSYKDHNNFTIPGTMQPGNIYAPASLAVLDASKFDGYCLGERDIIAHTDGGDYIGTLDAGPGNWKASTKLTFNGKQ